MPANMWDFSAIIGGDRSAAIRGASLAGLGDIISRGIGEYRQKKKEKEAEEAAVMWLKKNGQGMGLDHTDDGELKAAVKAAGGGLQAIQLISGLEQQKQQRALQQQQQQAIAAQLDQQKQQQATRLRQTAAARLAAGAMPAEAEFRALVEGGASGQDLMPATPSGPDAAVAEYLKRSGDIAGTGGLAEAYARLGVLNSKERGPYPVDFGDGLRGVVANGNFIMDPRLRQKPEPDTRKIVVGDRELTVGPGDKYFDKDGKPVQFTPDRRPAPPDSFLKSQDPELFEAMKAEYLAYGKRHGEEPGDKPAANDPFTTAVAVREARRAGRITREQAVELLQKRFGYK